MTEQAASVGYGLAWRGVRALPEPAARALFTAGAELAARRAGAGAWQLRRNLARVVPRAQSTELDQLVAAGLRSYARYWCEAFRLPSMDLGEVARGLDAGLS
ncbi:MAG: phosphatidylinositol mannoside acyltransferase, partial [Sciscionella sp.]